MEKQDQNVTTTTTAIKEEFNGDMTFQLDSTKEEVLDKDEKNCEILRNTQSTIVEHQKQQDQQQQQSEIIEIKSELIIDYQINNNEPEKIVEQGPSCSPNFDYAGYPGFLEAIRQAKRRKKSHDVSFEILFSYLPESVIKQHDLNLNEWWNYCLFENKDPLETDLSVVIGYLGKRLDVGASPDDLKSISSTVCLIASDKMERQIYSSSFLFSEFAKYSSVNNAADYKTSKSSCQNNSIISSLHIGTKKQDGSKKASVQIANAQKSKLSELIDISDDHSGNQSPSTALKPPTDVLNNNKPTEKKNVLLQKATNNAQVKTPLMKFPSTNPPAVKKSILTELINLSGDDLETKSPSTSRQKDVLNNIDQSNYKKNAVFIEQVFDNSQLITPLIKPTSTKPPAILLCPASKKKVCKNNEIKELIPGSLNSQQTQVVGVLENNKENQQITIKNKYLKEPSIMKLAYNVAVDDKSNLINEKYSTITMPILEQQQQDEVIQQQQSTLSAANNNQEKNFLKNNIASSASLTPSQLNTSALECSSNPLAQNIVKTSGNLQSGSSLVNAVRKKSQQQQKQHKARSYLQNKSSVLSVYSNQLPEKLESDSKSKSDLSDTSIHSDNSLDQILPTNDIEIYAFLQRVINNPQTAIVQDQIEGNSVKILIAMPKDEQTLITFDVPNEKFTVNDLLEQVGVPFNESTTVSLVKDPISKINYIVESEAGTIVNLTETSDVNDELSNDRNDDDDDNGWLNTDKKNIGTNLKVKSALLCHMVKIGSYKYTPTDHIIINTTGLTLSVPLLEYKSGTVRVHVAYRDIVKLLIYSGKPVSILFFYTNTISASKIRKLIDMNNPNGPYYDPASKNQTHQKIILFPISLKSNSIMILKKLFSSDTIIEELNAKQAYDILLNGASLKDYIDISSKIGKRQTIIVNTNSTFHPAAPTKSGDTNKSITKAKFAKLSCINKYTNVNDENNEKLNNGNDKLTNNDSRQKTSSFIQKKIVLDKSQPARKKHMSNDEFDKRIAANNNIKIFTNTDNIFPHTICSTLKSTNLLLRDKNNTTNSDNNSQRSIKNKINNNKRKHSQLEVTAEDENSNNILLSQKENF